MITPLDIHNKEFTKAFRGYKMEEVDSFLDEIIREVESLFRENRELKDTVTRLEEEVKKGRDASATLERTMVLAQKVFEEETQRAKKESELIHWEAEKKGQKLVEEAQKEVLEIRQKVERLRLYEKQLYLKHKGFLEFQMELLDGYNERDTVLTDTDMEKLSMGRSEQSAGEEEGDKQYSLPDLLSVQSENDEKSSTLAERPEAGTSTQGIGGEGNKASEAIVAEVGNAGSAAAEPGAMADGPRGEAEAKGPAEEEGQAIDQPATTLAAGAESPFLAKAEGDSMEQVVLLAQKMEEALKALDSMYGTDEHEEWQHEAER